MINGDAQITVQNIVDLCNVFDLEKSKTTIETVRFNDFLKIYLRDQESSFGVIIQIFNTSIIISKLTEQDCVTNEYSSISEFLTMVALKSIHVS